MKRVEPELALPRLSETNDPLAGAVSRLKQQGPDAAELASLASQLALRGLPLTAADSPPPGTSSLAWKKWALWGGGAVSGVGLWLALRAPPSPPASLRTPPPPALVAPSPAVAPTEPALPRTPAPRAPARAPAAVSSAEEPPGEVVTPGLAAPLPSEVAPSVAAAPLPGSSAFGNEPDEAADSPRRSVVAPSGRAATPVAVNRPSAPDLPSATTGPTEIELLRDARLSLRESPTRALALVESHARAFPEGKLTQERELIAISALVALGRRTAALSRASRFEQSFPRSPYRKQIADYLR